MSNKELPYVICHMMSTIDGRAASGTSVDIFDDYFSLYTETENELQGKTWMLGRVTMEMFTETPNTPLPQLEKNQIDYTDFITSAVSEYHMFAIDTKGVLRWKSNTITLSNISEPLKLIVVVTKHTPKEYLAYLQHNQISYVIGGDDEINFGNLLERMKAEFGVETLLLEGGGTLNGSVMAQGLIDEISLLLTPLILNKMDAPSIIQNKRDSVDTSKFTLADVKKLLNDVVWLRYTKSN